MGGGLLQLLAKGAQDHILVGNPQISHFKVVFRRHTNFSMETIKLDHTGNDISQTNKNVVSCIIKRNADMVSNIYFNFELPNIYSGSDDNQVPYEFKWVENIGHNVIDETRLIIGNTEIDKHNSNFLTVYSELRHNETQKHIHNKLIGNVPEVYDPSIGEYKSIPVIDNTTLGTLIDSINGNYIYKCFSYPINTHNELQAATTTTLTLNANERDANTDQFFTDFFIELGSEITGQVTAKTDNGEFTLDDNAEATDNIYKSFIIKINGEQRHISTYNASKTVETTSDFTNINIGDNYTIFPILRKIINYDSGTKIATIDPLESAPDTSIPYKIYRSNGQGMRVSIRKNSSDELSHITVENPGHGYVDGERMYIDIYGKGKASALTHEITGTIAGKTSNNEFTLQDTAGTREDLYNSMGIEVNGEQRIISDYLPNRVVQTSEEFTNISIGDTYRIYPTEPAFFIMYSKYPHCRYGNTSSQRQFSETTSLCNSSVTKNSDFAGSEASLIPSIPKRKIKVPLKFFFNDESGLALPLIALQYHETSVELTLKTIPDLFTINEILTETPTDGPTFASINRRKTTSDIIASLLSTTEFKLNYYFEATYIFLDNDERKRFAESSHSYLIQEVQTRTISNVSETKNHDMFFNHPVKELIIIGQRSDMKDINQWSNYTNWTNEYYAPYSYEYNEYIKGTLAKSTTNKIFYNKNFTIERTDNTKFFDMKYFRKNIINEIEILFNGNVRQRSRDHLYYNLQHPYNFHKTNPKDGVHVYSFSLNPNEFQPSGACNFSRIDNPQIKIDLGLQTGIHEIPNNLYSYDFTLYAVSYNILKIAAGMAGKQFAN